MELGAVSPGLLEIKAQAAETDSRLRPINSHTSLEKGKMIPSASGQCNAFGTSAQ